MNKILVLTILLCGISLTITAQVTTGKVTDEQQRPIAYANVVLINCKDSTYITGCISHEDGTFTLNHNTSSEQLLRVSALGYSTRYTPLTGREHYLITLAESTYELKGVEVTARRPTSTMGTEGIKTMVKGSYLEKLGSANDILPFIPGLSGEKGIFTVFGRGTPVFYINGRLMRNTAELERLKSEDIENIEVINNPGARYAATVNAVVKIKTRRKQGDGLSGDIRTVYEQNHYGSMRQFTSWNYRNGKNDFFGEINYSYDQGLRTHNGTEQLSAAKLWQYNHHGHTKSKQQSLNGVLGYNYQISNDHSLGLRYSWSKSPDTKAWEYLTQEIMADGIFQDQINSDIAAVYHMKPMHSLNLYYNGKLGKWAVDFNADYLYNKTEINMITNEYSFNQDDRTVTTNSSSGNQLYAAKLMLSHKLWSGTITLGAEYTYTDRKDNYINIENYLDPTDSRTREQIASPFVEYRLSSKIGQFGLGLRMEHARSERYRNGKEIADGRNTTNSLFPSFSYQHRLDKVDIMIGYSTRTLYPTYHQLSNPMTYANRYSIDVGNPMLGNKTVHDISLTTLWKIFQLNVSYSYHQDDILPWATEMEGQEGVVLRSYENLPKWQNLSASLSASPKWGIWHGRFSIGISKQWLTLQTDQGEQKMDKPEIRCTANNSFNFKHNWNATLNVRYTGKSDYRNYSYTHPSTVINASIQKTWCKNKFMLRLGVYDLLRQRYDTSWSYSNNYSSFLNERYSTRSVELTFRYRFNNTRNNYHGTGAGNSEKSRM